MDFRWEFLDRTGAVVVPDEVASPGQRFPSQSDAESWLGEIWPELTAHGAAAASLYEGDRCLYGPMSLLP